jgi:hypothetical protein
MVSLDRSRQKPNSEVRSIQRLGSQKPGSGVTWQPAPGPGPLPGLSPVRPGRRTLPHDQVTVVPRLAASADGIRCEFNTGTHCNSRCTENITPRGPMNPARPTAPKRRLAVWLLSPLPRAPQQLSRKTVPAPVSEDPGNAKLGAPGHPF